jgi:SAM-dependent methyltransferase
LLDVGCALGHLAALARLRGWRVTGIDVSAEAISQASVRFGLDVRAGSLARHRDTLGPFDTIFLGDCIEHVEEPAALLNDVRRTLAPGGLVCIDTPNWASRWRRWGRGRWIGLNRYHVNLFDAESLGRLLEMTDFTDIRAAAYTNYRYEAWSTRPEMHGWISRLPRFISWRIGRWLGGVNSNSPWAPLQSSPPVNLNQARELIIDYARRQSEIQPPSQSSGDNLIIQARRK